MQATKIKLFMDVFKSLVAGRSALLYFMHSCARACKAGILSGTLSIKIEITRPKEKTSDDFD